MRPEHAMPVLPWKKQEEPEDERQPVSSSGMLDVLRDEDVDFFESQASPAARKPERLRPESSKPEKRQSAKSGVRQKKPVTQIGPEIVGHGTIPPEATVYDPMLEQDFFLAHGTMPVAGDRSRPPFAASMIESATDEDDEAVTQRIIREISERPATRTTSKRRAA